MKKNDNLLSTALKITVSILLLALLLFNWVGYRLFSAYLESRSDIAIENRIDKSEYDESQLIELRVPLNAPYYSGNSASFETFHGELELSGVHYKYVKRKVDHGELVLLCLPDHNKTNFQNSRSEFFKLVNDLNNSSGQTKEKNSNSSSKSFSSDFTEDNNFLSVASVLRADIKPLTIINSPKLSGYLSILKRPPRA